MLERFWIRRRDVPVLTSRSFLSSLLRSTCSDLMHYMPSSQDPVKDGEQQIRKDFDALYEDMQTAFRNLED